MGGRGAGRPTRPPVGQRGATGQRTQRRAILTVSEDNKSIKSLVGSLIKTWTDGGEGRTRRRTRKAAAALSYFLLKDSTGSSPALCRSLFITLSLCSNVYGHEEFIPRSQNKISDAFLKPTVDSRCGMASILKFFKIKDLDLPLRTTAHSFCKIDAFWFFFR